MSENDAEFIEIMMQDGDWARGSRMHRLALLARRGADAAAEIERLRAEVERLTKDLKMAIRSDSEECNHLTAEVERLLKSRNRWGQKYNKLLLKIRAGLGEADDPASWQLRDEQAARIAQLEAALREIAYGKPMEAWSVARTALTAQEKQ